MCKRNSLKTKKYSKIYVKFILYENTTGISFKENHLILFCRGAHINTVVKLGFFCLAL